MTQQEHARIAVPGTYNFRDVGGLPVASGGRIREQVLYRSDALHRLGAAGKEALRELDVRAVIDLRDDEETQWMPDDLEGLDVEVLRLPVFEGAAGSLRGITLAGLYRRIIERHADVVVRALREIADIDGAVVVHCTAGKDRTGLVVALALLAVGVDREQVADDYVITERNLAGAWLDGMVALAVQYGASDTPELREVMGGSPRTAIEAILDLIDAEYGSPREYLLRAGLTEAELQRLRERLVDAG